MDEKQVAQTFCAILFIASGILLLSAGLLGRPKIGPGNIPSVDRLLGQSGKRMIASIHGAIFVVIGFGILLGCW